MWFIQTLIQYLFAHGQKKILPAKKPSGGPELLAWESAKDETIKLGEQLANQFTKEGAELEFETAYLHSFLMGLRKDMLAE